MKLTLFRKAQVRLTVWYVAIMLTLTISYSAIVYHNLLITTQQALEAHQQRLEKQFPEMKEIDPYNNEDPKKKQDLPFPNRYDSFVNPSYQYDIEALTYIRKKVLLNLIIINTVIALITGILGYFLAGATLKPIRNMVDKQKQFISNAAHEFRTPLAAMKTEIEVTLRDKDLTLDEAKIALDGSLEELRRLETLTQGLLMESRYQSKRKTLVIGPLNIKPLLKNVVKGIEPIAKEKNININLIGNDFLVSGNEQSLKELFSILIDNAVKYSDVESKVNVSMKKENRYGIIVISDTGIGIDENDLPNIFDRFYRADQSRNKNNVEGYGLGLSIAKEIVDIHNGEIYVESKKNQGTQFTIKLPC